MVLIIASFFSSRKTALFNGTNSFLVKLDTECPQGSVMSAFLWLVLFDDILQLLFDFDFLNLAYADDITLPTSHSDPETATSQLQSICAVVMLIFPSIFAKLLTCYSLVSALLHLPCCYNLMANPSNQFINFLI